MAIPAIAQSQTYLPEVFSGGSCPLPERLRCPAPYVEMIMTERDPVFDRAWYCRETQHYLGQVRGSIGCSGGRGEGKMFPGWAIPAATQAASAPDYRA